MSPVDVKLQPGLITQPDLLVVPNGELRTRTDFIQHLVLAAEVLSWRQSSISELAAVLLAALSVQF